MNKVTKHNLFSTEGVDITKRKLRNEELGNFHSTPKLKIDEFCSNEPFNLIDTVACFRGTYSQHHLGI